MAQTRIRPDEQLTTGTQGDILLRNAGGEWQDLGIGASGEVLTSNGTTASWQASGGAGLCSTGTYAALEVIRAASGLTPGCHYKLTGYSNGNAALGTVDLILLAADVDKFAEDVAVLTTLDDEAWPGKFDWDAAVNNNRLYELYDGERHNLWSGISSLGNATPRYFINNANLFRNRIINSELTITGTISTFSYNYIIFSRATITIGNSLSGYSNHIDNSVVTLTSTNLVGLANFLYNTIKHNSALTVNGTNYNIQSNELKDTSAINFVTTGVSGITVSGNSFYKSSVVSITGTPASIGVYDSSLYNSTIGATTTTAYSVVDSYLYDSSIGGTNINLQTISLESSNINSINVAQLNQSKFYNTDFSNTASTGGGLSTLSSIFNNTTITAVTQTAVVSFADSGTNNATITPTTSAIFMDCSLNNCIITCNADTIDSLHLGGNFTLNTGGFNVTNVQIIDDGTQTLTANNTGTYRGFGTNTLV